MDRSYLHIWGRAIIVKPNENVKGHPLDERLYVLFTHFSDLFSICVRAQSHEIRELRGRVQTKQFLHREQKLGCTTDGTTERASHASQKASGAGKRTRAKTTHNPYIGILV